MINKFITGMFSNFARRAVNCVRLLTALILCNGSAFATPEATTERLVVSVNGERYKFGIDVEPMYVFKLRISKDIAGEWVRQVRYLPNVDHYECMETLDWNEDGHTDVRVRFVAGCRPEHEDMLFIYDPVNCEYRNIEMYWWYCGSDENPVSVKGSGGYYYSHRYWGCESDSWESLFFKIEEYKIKVAGSIAVNYCEEPRELVIYKCYQDENGIKKSEQVAKISAGYISRKYDDELGVAWQYYCANFWSKHFDRVLN